MDPAAAADLIATWGYPALLVFLLATGFGSPIPEDLILLTAGFLIASDIFSWGLALPLALAGVVGSDTVLFAAGWQMRTRALRSRSLRRLLRPGPLRLATHGFGRIGEPIIFFARLIPGTRAVVFLTAGLRGVRPARFLAYDVAGAVIWVPALLTVGGFLEDRVGGFHRLMTLLTRGVTWAIVAAAALLIVWYLLGREQSKL